MSTFAVLELAAGTEVHWIAGSTLLGRFERGANSVRTRAATALLAMTVAHSSIGSVSVTYDNAPRAVTVGIGVTPTGAKPVTATVGVRWRDVERRGTSPEPDVLPYRFSGELLISFFVPRTYGSGTITEALDHLIDELRWLEDGEVKYGIPSVEEGAHGVGEFSAPGQRGHNQYARTLTVPFYLDEDVARASAAGAAEADHDTIGEVCRTRFETEIATPSGIVAVYDNQTAVDPDLATFATLEVLQGSTAGTSLGAPNDRNRAVGIAQASLYVEAGTGDANALAIADLIFDAFHSVDDRGVHFLAPAIRTSGRTGPYWRIVVDVPFNAEQIQ